MDAQREARRDAKEYARAQMFYGEGAGTRRKLITATVDAKALRNPTYERAFFAELARQDMADHAKKARHERSRKDTTEALNKNVKALATGNYQGVQSTVLAVVVAGYFAHQAGLDRKLYQKSQEVLFKIRLRIKDNPELDKKLTKLHIPH